MLYIDRTTLIGRGRHRECYKHPEDQNLCIKITVKDSPLEIKRGKKYYRHLQKHGISWEMISRYHGDVETDLGQGAVFDLIMDHDGTVAKSLEYYLSSDEQTEKYFSSLSDALCRLKKYLLQNRIVTMDIKPYNILCQMDASGIARLVLIDNIYNSEFIPVSNYCRFFAKRKIDRKWQRFEDSLLNAFNGNKALARMLKERSVRRSSR